MNWIKCFESFCFSDYVNIKFNMFNKFTLSCFIVFDIKKIPF